MPKIEEDEELGVDSKTETKIEGETLLALAGKTEDFPGECLN
jgi:hypothetical protein